MTDTKSRTPALFVSHGAPTLATDKVAGADFERLATSLPRPQAILVWSAHWLDAPPTLGTSTTRDLLYDFAGFPPELYELEYRAPAAAELSRSVAALVPGLHHDDRRPWDHGVWVPLLHMFPHADVPVLQLSLPRNLEPSRLFELGRRLAPLREQGVLLLGSGGAVHNLGAVDWRSASTPAWALEFEQWLRERLLARDLDSVMAFRERAPALRLAHPTDEHLLPLMMTLGAGSDDDVTFPIEGFEHGSLSRLAVQLG